MDYNEDDVRDLMPTLQAVTDVPEKHSQRRVFAAEYSRYVGAAMALEAGRDLRWDEASFDIMGVTDRPKLLRYLAARGLALESAGPGHYQVIRYRAPVVSDRLVEIIRHALELHEGQLFDAVRIEERARNAATLVMAELDVCKSVIS